MLRPTPTSTPAPSTTPPSGAAVEAHESTANNPWHARLAPYRAPSAAKSIWQLTSTLVLLALSWGAVFALVSIGSWWALLPIPLAAGLLVRTFVLQHDCGHRSFFRSTAANDRIGVWLGLITLTPYHTWRRLHAVHHATSGDLDRRGKGGEILLLTVDEYRARGFWGRLAYRLYRNPFVLFGIGPFYQFAIKQRFAYDLPKTWKRERRSVWFTNIGAAVLLTLGILAFGWQTFVLAYVPVLALGSAIGVWMFYVQHQYEEGYFHHRKEWDYVDAAIKGSSHFRLPKVLQWMTANIGIHHVHHLDSRIPNYLLQTALDQQPELQAAEQMTLADAFRVTRLKIWDEKSERLLTWGEYARLTADEKRSAS